MPVPILATKLFIPPPRSSIVFRPRLMERLNEGLSLGCKLTLISAPAGFGKTTLVSEWVASPRNCPPKLVCGSWVAWLSLDEADNDLVRFISYLVAALRIIKPGIGENLLSVLQGTQPFQIETLLTTLLNEITNTFEPFVLILDDYHLIDSRQVDSILEFLVENLPPQMHLVVTTREDPQLSLARYRARGQLTELRAADLRFTPSEAADFLNQVMSLNLSAENVIALENRTEGWIAGLQLSAISMQGHLDTTNFIKSFTGSHRFVLDYLIEEVLHQQPEPIREFLLQTSMLDKFCASLCDAVTEHENGKEFLGFIERNNLFLIPLDDQRQWYRYHRLFADVLQTYLMEAQPDHVSTLHRRASKWYEQNGLRSDAIHHALAAKDFDRAAGLIELSWPAAEEGSIQPALWISWVKTLPDEMFHTRPVLNVDYAYALLGIGEIEAAETRLKDVERWLKPKTGSPGMIVVDLEQFKSLPETFAIGRAYIAQAFGNIQETIKYTSQVLELVPEGDAFRRDQASMMLGMTYWATGILDAAERVFADHTLRLRKAGNISIAISTTVVLADIRLALGRLQEAIHSIEELIHFILDQGGPNSPDEADLHRELSDLYLEQLNREGASQQLQKSKELGEKADLPVWRYRWCFSQARFKATQDNLDGALESLNEAEKLHIRTPLPDLCHISAMKARIWVAQGRLAKALEWVNGQRLSADDDLSFLREFDHITLATILIAQYQNDQSEDAIQAAMRLLDRLLQVAEEGSRMGSVIKILILRSLAHQAQGNFTPALAALQRALTLAEPEGYVRIFVEEDKPMAELLNRMAADEETPRIKAYIQKLLSAFDELKKIGITSPTSKRKSGSSIREEQAVNPQPLIEPLSARELDVLRLLRTDMNGPEIARELTVSLSTLRTHTQRIFAKLGVNNRRAAVRRAEELQLL